MVTNKVVLKFKDASIVKGQTNNFLPNRTFFHLQQLEGGPIEVHIEDLKAIFFVKNYEGAKDHKKTYNDKVAGGGRKIRVKFLDGETIVGYTTGYSPDRPGFYIVPSDLKGNNDRIFVVKTATEEVEML
ncbi:MAG: hypothetical protein HY895_02255 [Deltaproteobacteria bacterium]|nr:hypothetical protein [Deltaproteobacteria bacterium]